MSFAVYFNSLNNDFVFDDQTLIVDNPVIKSSEFLSRIFKKNLYDYPGMANEITSDQMYRPLQSLTYSIDYRIWGLRPLGFRLANILLHLINSILIYYLLITIFENNALSKIISVLFLVHPIHTSVVSYISGRADLLVRLFMFLSMICFLEFIKSGSKVYYTFSLLSALFALLSRENALTLFVFLTLILFIIKAKPKYYFHIMPFILLDLFYLILRFFLLGHSGILIHTPLLSLPLRIVTFFNILLEYLLILLLPLDLHLFRSIPFIRDLLEARTFFALIFILFYFLGVVRLRKNKLFVFSMLWFLIAIIPVFLYMDSFPVLNEAMMAESWVYIASLGFFILLAYILKSVRKTGGIIIASLTVFYAFLTIANNKYWKNEFVLYEYMLGYAPKAIPMRKNLIYAYLENGLDKKAISEINKFTTYAPDSPDLDMFWGGYFLLIGRPLLAIDKYSVSLSKNPKNFYAYYNLTSCYKELGQLDRAINCALQCFEIKPYHFLNLIRLGDLYSEKKQFSEGLKYYLRAYEIDPSDKMPREKIKKCKANI